MPVVTPRTARLMSASSKTMFGDLPPSSSDTRFSVSAQPRMIALPTAVEPVKVILSMPGCATIALPVSPKPVSTLRMPLGRPTSSRMPASATAVSGVCSAGFRMTALPIASAGAIFIAAIISGKFQGMMAPTTPTASRRV